MEKGPPASAGAMMISLSLDKRNREPIDLLLRIPRHHVLAAFHDVEVDLGLGLLEELGALAGMGAILAAVDQHHRDLELERALPLRHRRLLAAAASAFFRACALGEDLEVAADAAAVAQRELLRCHQLGME